MGFSQDVCFDICKKYGSNFFENNFVFFFSNEGAVLSQNAFFAKKLVF